MLFNDRYSLVRTVNGQTGDVSLTASDVNALPSTTSIPSTTSDLTNASNVTGTTATDALNMLNNLSTMLTSDVENGALFSKAYEKGQFIMRYNKLYRLKTAVSNSTLIANSNIEAININDFFQFKHASFSMSTAGISSKLTQLSFSIYRIGIFYYFHGMMTTSETLDSGDVLIPDSALPSWLSFPIGPYIIGHPIADGIPIRLIHRSGGLQVPIEIPGPNRYFFNTLSPAINWS